MRVREKPEATISWLQSAELVNHTDWNVRFRWLPERIVTDMQARADSPDTLRATALPLVASFITTGWAMVLVCRFQLGSTLSAREFFIFPLICIAVTAVVHAATVWLAQRLLDMPGSPAVWPLIYRTFPPVAWVPLLIVLATHGSIWVALLLPLIAALVTRLLVRTARSSDQPSFQGDLQSLFVVPAPATRAQTILPAVLAAIAAQTGLLAAMTHRELLAGLLLAGAGVLPVARLLRRTERSSTERYTTVARNSVAALLLLTIAMLPFLKAGPGQAALERLMQMQRVKAAIAASAMPHPGTGYSGIILMPPSKRREAMLPPVPTASLKSTRGKPLVIPFSGVYWYFKEPDERPRRDAPIVHGDPLKAKIRSTTRLPLLMEAHQIVLPALKLVCCSAVAVNLTNADTREGIIALEVVLRDTEGKGAAPVSLGTRVIPSTTATNIPFDRPAVSETLTFTIPRYARNRRCSEITLRLKPAGSRSLVASQVSVDSFVLVP